MAGTTLPLLDPAASIADTTLFLGRLSGETTDKKITGAVLKAYIASDTASLYYTKTQSDARFQPLDADLTAIAGLTSAADRGIYFTGSGTASLFTLTSYGRSLVDDADASTARGTLGLGTIATQNANSVSLTGGTLNGVAVTGLSSPSNGSDAATKDYVDAATAGLSQKNAVTVATTGALTATYSNGTSGVGATLTNSGTQAALTLDGVLMTVGRRVLVKNQASAFQNGIYTVTTVGTVSTNWVLTRATDFDAAAEISEGAYTIVEEGTPDTGNQGTLWIQTNSGPFTVGTTSLNFTQLLVAPQTKTFTGDVTGTGTSTVALTIGANKVLDSMIRQSAGLSIIGNSTNSTANVADITAASDNQVLRRSGTSIAFGAIALNQSNAVTGVLGSTNGGTGVNNASTITLGGAINTAGAFTTAGAFGITLTATALTAVTLPTTGTLATLAGVEQFTNKRVIPRVLFTTSAATITPNGDAYDVVGATAQAVGLTIANPSGTPNNGQPLQIRIKDNATPQTIAYGTIYRAIGVALPTTTVSGQTLYLNCTYNAADTKWDVDVVVQYATLTGSEALTNKSVNGVTLTAAGSAKTFLDGTGAYNSDPLNMNNYLHVQDQKSSGTGGGNSSVGNNTRTLNSTVENSITGSSLSSSQITLPAGKYFILARAPAYATLNTKLRWYNVTDTTYTIEGASSSVTNSTFLQTDTWLMGTFTIAGTKAFELRQYTSNATTGGFGQPASQGTEVYADVEIWKI